jgi:hypothetical protein
MKMPTYHKNEHGVALVISLMFLAILGMLGTTAYVMTSTDLKIGRNYQASAEAFFDADAGINYGRSMVEAGFKAGSFTMPPDIGDPTDASDANSTSLVSFTSPTGFNFAFQDPGMTKVSNNPEVWTYTCIGTEPNNNSTATITAKMKFLPGIMFGVFGDKKMETKNSAAVYSYSHTTTPNPTPAGSTEEGDVGSNESVILKNGSYISGDTALGEDTAGNDATLSAGGATVVGENGKDIDRVDPDPLGVVGGEYESKFTTYSTSNDNGDASLVFDPDSAISGIDLTLDNSETMTLKGKTGGANYYFDDIILKNSSTLYIDTTNGPVNIYLTGEINAITGSNFVNTTDATCAGVHCTCVPSSCTRGAPGDFAIFCNSQDSTDKISIGNDVTFSGLIYAPYITVRLDNSANIYGAIVAQEAEITNSVDIFFDTDMKDQYTTQDLTFVTWETVYN